MGADESKVIALLEQFVQTEAAKWERFDKVVMKEIKSIKSRQDANLIETLDIDKRLKLLELWRDTGEF